MLKIGITGGIGSGKSTLSRHFEQSGIPLYNSDRRAKELMVEDAAVVEGLKRILGSECYCGDGGLNREYIASKIFNSPELLDEVNSVVHPAVGRDFLCWVEAQSDVPYVIFESALLFSPLVELYVDRSVAVLAPKELRIMRVVSRDDVSVEQVEARMSKQLSDEEFHSRADHTVVNIIEDDLAGAAQRLDQIFKKIAADVS